MTNFNVHQVSQEKSFNYIKLIKAVSLDMGLPCHSIFEPSFSQTLFWYLSALWGVKHGAMRG